ncbi:MAG: hypothetical protein HY821_08265 [Acidobacteria bacterium]|nr:hypothetical protein [Acidobacteriota bacterium]
MEEILWITNMVLTVGVLVRLAMLRLISTYPALSAFLALQSVRSFWLLPYSVNTNEYAIPYIFTEPVLVLSRALVVFELYEKILSGYRGLSVLSRRTMSGCLGVSLVLALAAHLREFLVMSPKAKFLQGLNLFESTVFTALLFFLVILAAFMLYYPTPIRKNVLLHSWAFSAYFAGTAVALYLSNTNFEAWNRIASVTRMSSATLSLMAWCLLLRKSWESESSAISVNHSKVSQERLLQQLESLNMKLERNR